MDIYEYVSLYGEGFEQIHNFVGVGTLDHKYAFANTKTAKIMGFKSSSDITNIHFSNVKCKAAEDAPFFESENNLVISQNKKISVLGYHCYSNDWSLVLCEKSPLINKDSKLIGVLMYFIDVTNYNLIDYSRFLLNLKYKFLPSNKKSFSYRIEDGTDNPYNLSNRQIECLFFLLRGKSNKEIGSILGLSARTVEDYINEIKLKLNCLTKSQTIEKCLHEGLFNMIPKRFIK